jgi:tRNA pseudouridine synthase 10
MDGREAVFHGAGREDVDARMLGGGRPFVIEVKEPRAREVDTATLQETVNDFAGGTVEVEGLTPATYEMVERVKELEASKRYRMAVSFEEPVDRGAFAAALAELEGATIHQETPQRVDHRRASKTRTREVYDVAGQLGGDLEEPRVEQARAAAREAPGGDQEGGEVAPDDRPTEPDGEETATRATISVHGAGGLYVKELVSGDEGRTEPSLAGLLGVDAHVTALDVLDVAGEAEPFEDPDYFRSGVKDIDPREATDE